MNTSLQEGIELAKQVNELVKATTPSAEIVIAPPFIHITQLAELLTNVKLGAQNCASEAGGAYTGEVSAQMLAEAGVRYVIVAHSERREYQKETDDLFVKKINLIHEAGLKAIFCYGELLDERKAGQAEAVVRRQLEGVLPKLKHADAYNTVLAYEPVWAIGTGETATPEQAQEIHAFSRAVVAELLGADVAQYMRILYGGSCKPGNARELIGQADIDGGLIGGAALKAADFTGIIDGAEASQG